jgi:hypothetical protein
MAHVRTFQAGRNGALSQQLLNELSSARLCLLNPAKKTVYDGELSSKLNSAPKAVPVAPAAAVPKAQPVAKVVPRAVGSPPSASQSGVLSGNSGILDAGPSASSVLHSGPSQSGVSQSGVTQSGVLKSGPSQSGVVPAAASRSGISQSQASQSGISQTAIPRAASQSGVSQSAAIARPKTVVATQSAPASAGLDIDNETMDALTSSPDFQIRARRRTSTATQAWKRPVALGILAGVIVVSFFLLYVLIRRLTSSDEWKRGLDFIKGQPQAGVAAPTEPAASAADNAAPPPAPEAAE